MGKHGIIENKAMRALVAKAEAVRDQTQQAVDELTSAYRLIAG